LNRFGRIGLYEFGYDLVIGGSGEDLHTEHEGNEAILQQASQINCDALNGSGLEPSTI
jgi:hypothetical protein